LSHSELADLFEVLSEKSAEKTFEQCL